MPAPSACGRIVAWNQVLHPLCLERTSCLIAVQASLWFDRIGFAGRPVQQTFSLFTGSAVKPLSVVARCHASHGFCVRFGQRAVEQFLYRPWLLN